MKFWIVVSIVVVLVGGWLAFQYFVPTFNLPSTATPYQEAPNLDEERPAGALEAEEAWFLKLPEGYRAYYYSKEVPNARVMEFVPDGMLVSQTGAGLVSLLTDRDGNGVAEVKTVISGLDSPHGLGTVCEGSACDLYVATHSALLKYRYERGTANGPEKLLDISNAGGDRHKTRTLMFLPFPNDSKLLISVGSSCDVCFDEGDRGKIIWYDINTGEKGDYATGLRNAVFMALHPVTGDVYMTEMGRDRLGDDLPPDEVNVVSANVSGVPNFGWPACYGNNVFDDEFNANIRYIKNPCEEPDALPAWLDLQAHSAPLGLSFIPEEGWPEEMWHDLIIAYHGSWNRSVPTGYKVVRVHIDASGKPVKTEDFITGFLTEDGTKLGRPSGVRVLPGGTMYIADDVLGAVYRVVRE